MPTHIALLRAVNVGGGGKIAMADLRRVVSSLGHSEVATYIQTGNVLFTPPHADAAALAGELEEAIAATLSVTTAVIVLSKAELADVVAGNPYAAEPHPKFVHTVFLPSDPAEPAARLIEEAVALTAAKGSRDQAALVGRTVYLHTPDGYGDSPLARTLLLRRSSPVAAGTARNWATVTRLLAMCGE